MADTHCSIHSVSVTDLANPKVMLLRIVAIEEGNSMSICNLLYKFFMHILPIRLLQKNASIIVLCTFR